MKIIENLLLIVIWAAKITGFIMLYLLISITAEQIIVPKMNHEWGEYFVYFGSGTLTYLVWLAILQEEK